MAPVTVKACELGYRNPSRLVLIALLRALDVEEETRAALLEAAGFSREGAAQTDRLLSPP